jgi:hypothetical protein
MVTISWLGNLGGPTKPGKYSVRGLGEVEVTQEQIDQARAMGGNPGVEVHDVTAFGDLVKQYIIGLFVP